MIQCKVKLILGYAISICNFLGTYPYKWNFKTQRIFIPAAKTAWPMIKWVTIMVISFCHALSLTLKFYYGYANNLFKNHVSSFLHIFWTLGYILPAILHLNTILSKNDIIKLVNKTLQYDERLSSKHFKKHISKIGKT